MRVQGDTDLLGLRNPLWLSRTHKDVVKFPMLNFFLNTVGTTCLGHLSLVMALPLKTVPWQRGCLGKC